MDRRPASENRLERAKLAEAVNREFAAAKYLVLRRGEEAGPLDLVFSGNGMIWGVVFLSTFDELKSRWVDSDEDTTSSLDVLSQIATSDVRWNIALLAIVNEPLREEHLPAVSEFQEDPKYFARFVTWLKSPASLDKLKTDIAFLLLEWIEGGARAGVPQRSPLEEIHEIIVSVGSETRVGRLDRLWEEARKQDPDEERIASAILEDSGKKSSER